MRLTKPQELIYTMEKFSDGAIATLCGSALFNGTTDIDKAKRAVNELYCRNDALRIVISEKDGGIEQYISEFVPQEVPVLRFQDEQSLTHYAEGLAHEPINIYEKLCSIYIVILPEKYGILVRMHHIISDAWTLSLVASQFYAFINGEKITTFSYADYVEKESEYLGSSRHEKDRQYWMDCFNRCPEPVYFSEKQSENTASERLTKVVSSVELDIINRYAKEHKSSIYSLMMTAISVYFSRIKNNAERFYIGTAVLNRSGFAEKNTMGMFINTVPFLIELNNNQTFSKNLDFLSRSSFAIQWVR